jgi:hypothetical protein
MEDSGTIFAHLAPDYMPGLVVMALMASVDVCYLDAGLQYSRQSFQNRARLRTPDGVQWITVPVVGGQFGRSIADTRIDYTSPWVRKHLKALRFNYGSAPFYQHYAPDIGGILQTRHDTLGPLNIALLEQLHGFLGLKCRLVRAAPREDDDPGLGTNVRPVQLRVAPEDGRQRDASPADEVQLLAYEHPRYRQNFDGFEPGMSILDLLFTSGPEAGPILLSGIRSRGAMA